MKISINGRSIGTDYKPLVIAEIAPRIDDSLKLTVSFKANLLAFKYTNSISFEDDLVTAKVTASDGSIFVAGNFMSCMMYGEEGIQATGLQYDEDFFIGKAFPNGTWDWMVGGGSDIGQDTTGGLETDLDGDTQDSETTEHKEDNVF